MNERKALTFTDKVKVLDHMQAHCLIQKQATAYWQENGY